ncbi:MAG: hypothetical protein ACREOU_00480 [Candidatus Eiseniibacteriota bacterium]
MNRNERATPTPVLTAAFAVVLAALVTAAIGTVSLAGSKSVNTSWTQTWHNDGKGQKEFAYGIVDPEARRSFIWGDTKDFNSVTLEEKSSKSSYVWARIGKKKWRIDDPVTVGRAFETVQPIQELGEEQGRVGELQGSLGEQQGQLGEIQGQIGERQGAIGALQAEIGMLQANLALSSADEERRARLNAKQAELQSQQAELQRWQSNLMRHQSTMGKTQSELGKEQSKLAERTNELLPKATKEMRSIVDQAIKIGTAKPL